MKLSALFGFEPWSMQNIDQRHTAAWSARCLSSRLPCQRDRPVPGRYPGDPVGAPGPCRGAAAIRCLTYIFFVCEEKKTTAPRTRRPPPSRRSDNATWRKMSTYVQLLKTQALAPKFCRLPRLGRPRHIYIILPSEGGAAIPLRTGQ